MCEYFVNKFYLNVKLIEITIKFDKKHRNAWLGSVNFG